MSHMSVNAVIIWPRPIPRYLIGDLIYFRSIVLYRYGCGLKPFWVQQRNKRSPLGLPVRIKSTPPPLVPVVNHHSIPLERQHFIFSAQMYQHTSIMHENQTLTASSWRRGIIPDRQATAIISSTLHKASPLQDTPVQSLLGVFHLLWYDL